MRNRRGPDFDVQVEDFTDKEQEMLSKSRGFHLGAVTK